MRIFFCVAIAFLLTILVAGISLAHTMERPCHENMQVGGAIGVMAAMDTTGCCCTPATKVMKGHFERDIRGMADCCPSEECGGLLLSKEVALSATLSLAGFSGMVQTPAFFQPVPWALLGTLFTGLPPPRFSATPVYIQHCSFLI